MFKLYATGMALLSSALVSYSPAVIILLGLTTGFLVGASIAEVITFIKRNESKRLLAFPIGGVLGVICTIILFII